MHVKQSSLQKLFRAFRDVVYLKNNRMFRSAIKSGYHCGYQKLKS